jgi:hypothetical protein
VEQSLHPSSQFPVKVTLISSVADQIFDLEAAV